MSEWEAVLRLALAAVLGGAIGFEREKLDKNAGLRTHMLVSLGAALFMTSSILLVYDFGDGPELARVDPSRIASTIVTGIGFLGGGLILKERGRVQGLTTAAGLWVSAAIGLAAGSGYYITAAGAVALALVILVVMRRFEAKIDGKEARDAHEVPDAD